MIPKFRKKIRKISKSSYAVIIPKYLAERLGTNKEYTFEVIEDESWTEWNIIHWQD